MKKGLFCVAAGILLLSFGACRRSSPIDNNDYYSRIHPSGPKPAWGPDITPQMQAVIEVLDTIAPTPIQDLTPDQARAQPTPADAVMRVMKNFGIPQPAANVDTMGRDIPVGNGTIHLRIYKPTSNRETYPLVLYYHGGGWVIATIDTYNASAQALAEKTDAIVVSVEYRKGPEFKFPTAHNDAYAAYKWAIQNASLFGADSTNVATAGESAGGNMAITVAMMARDSGFKRPAQIVSVYPVASNDPNTASKIKYADAKPLNSAMLPWFLKYYLSDLSQSANPLISLVNANFTGLPPTLIISAEIDPLQTEGGQLADKVQAAGVYTTRKLYQGVTHEFFGMATVVPEAKDAQELASQTLRKALSR